LVEIGFGGYDGVAKGLFVCECSSDGGRKEAAGSVSGGGVKAGALELKMGVCVGVKIGADVAGGVSAFD
jgi:hypothetical protein